jgi:uncharacterized protein
MRGEELAVAFVGFAGVYGDRLFAFRSSARPEGFPYLTGREQEEMLLYRPRFRHPDRASRPPNLAAAEAVGVTPLFAAPADLALEVETPTGEVLDVEDPALLRMLGKSLREGHVLTLLRSERAMTDCRPVSLISLQTVEQIGEELGEGGGLDPRRFRANVYVDSASGRGFGEDAFVGRSLRIGSKVVVSVLERDPRCKMISLDPDTGEHNPQVLRTVARVHGNMAGVYCAVLVEGVIKKGDSVELVD